MWETEVFDGCVGQRPENGSAEGKATRTESKRQSSEQKAWGCMDRMHIFLAVSIFGCDLASPKAPGVNVEQTHQFYDGKNTHEGMHNASTGHAHFVDIT